MYLITKKDMIMTMINKVEIIKSGGMKQYIEPTKKVALELKIISDKIKNEIYEKN